MSKKAKSIIAVFSIFALFAIAAPIYFYIKDFHELPRSSDPAEWGPFGDFFGGILNPIISMLTLIVTVIIAVTISKIEKRHHEETFHSQVKPLITIESSQFFSSDISRIGPTVEKDFYDYTPPQEPAGPDDYFLKPFYLKINNLGLGIASQVSITFEIELSELRRLLVIDDPKLQVSASDVKTEEDGREFITLSIKSDPFNYQGFFFKIWGKERYGLGVIDRDKEVKALVPSQMMGAFQLHNLIRRLKSNDIIFPTIVVTFAFKDIHGKALESKFKVALVHVHDYLHYSIFRIIQEEI